MAPRRAKGWMALVAAVCAAGCVEQADRAAKKRVFSPEEPPKPVLAASQPIDVARLGADSALAWRVVTLGAPEAFERIGPFRFKANASFQWSLGSTPGVSLAEQRLLEQTGANEFYVRTDNDRDQGFEITYVSDRAYARSRYQKFRERKRDRGQSARLRDDAFGALKTVAALADNRLAFTQDGEEKVFGRAAQRYRIALAEQPLQVAERDAHLPAVEYPAGGPDRDTKRRIDLATLREPRSVEGKLWVDAETGVPLKADLTAVVRAPGEGSTPAQLQLRVHQELQPGAPGLAVAAPEDFLPDEDRPNAIAAALERFGVSRPDAGTSAQEGGKQETAAPDEE